jgi:5-methylcytosine-specific restriction endonuclease McrA
MSVKEFDVKAYAISVLRRASYRSPTRNLVLKNAKRARNSYKCAKCSTLNTRANIQIDHILPVVPLTGWVSFDDYIYRMFCGVMGLQVLCKPCHKEKSNAENAIRRTHRKPKLRRGRK